VPPGGEERRVLEILMDEETRSRCLTHLREASLCLENTANAVVAVRLQDIIETIEQETSVEKLAGAVSIKG
jgi:hypothetical protein